MKVLQPGLFMLLTLLVSCAAPPVPRGQVPSPRPKPEVPVAQLEKKIHELINKERTKQGLSVLSWNESLAKIARKHSRDMAARNYFSHQSPEGRSFSDRYAQDRFQCGITVKQAVYGGAENIFQNNLYDRVVFVNGRANYEWNSIEDIAETTVRGWMNSPGHRKNILTPHWRSEGIGIGVSPDDKVYITQNFC